MGDNSLKKKSITDNNLFLKMGIMVAVSVILGLIKFPLLPTISFLTYDFADVPILISGFAFGPVIAIAMVVVVSAIQAFLLGGDGIYGFVMHVVSSGTFVLVASCIYAKKKTKKRAIISMIVATIALTAIMVPLNYVVTPYYYSISVEGSSSYDAVQNAVVMSMYLIIGFNLIKGTLNSIITFIVYKKVSTILHSKNFGND